MYYFFFFFNDTATTEIYTLSLHDALPIFQAAGRPVVGGIFGLGCDGELTVPEVHARLADVARAGGLARSEEHTSELQSRQYLVCRLLLEKKKKLAKSFYITENYILSSYTY